MLKILKKIYHKEMYQPSWLGIFINPFYFARKGLSKNINKFSKKLSGSLLDIGCGSKPYESFFNVDSYIGLDIDRDVARDKKKADFFYDGGKFPFKDGSFDCVFCSEVIEHVFNPDEFLSEINRVLKKDGEFLITAPFIWDEHEQPYDYARYSSFGLKSLLEKNYFTILEHKKIGTNFSTFFQLINGYLYKIIESWPKYIRLLIVILIMSCFNLLGLFFGKFLPKNKDFYLTNIFLVKK
jgi:SAM-dependent methyltransferase|tara:strand:+ start:920 stop:1636 length:717 start_codon:yes stop_codon:yes gene_type:complete